VLTNHHVTIQEANILTTSNHFDLDTYIILDENNQAFFNEKRILNIQKSLIKHLREPKKLPKVTEYRLSRAKAHFSLSPQITFSDDIKYPDTGLFLIAEDRPGLLARVSRVFK
jgi:[protein-PII] uridylyltransferase